MDEKAVSDALIDASDQEKNGSFYPMLFGVSCAFLALKLMPEICDGKWSENSENKELLQKLENAEKQILELKTTRTEDAKANEKVVSIFAAREQSWFHERKNLRHQIESTKKEYVEKLKDAELMLESKDKLIQEVQEKLKKAETLIDELREHASSEITKHKTAFIELEAETGRAKQELGSVSEQKEQLVSTNQRLSIELVKMHKDLEHKDQILAAMMRKSKIDTAEKQMLIKEVKSSKTKRKQAEVEAAHWKAISESKNERYSLRNMLPNKHTISESDDLSGCELLRSKDLTGEHLNHHAVDAFVEQLRLKDEKLEAFCWRLVSMEIESSRLQSLIKVLDHDIEKLKQDNAKLTSLHLISPPNHQKLNLNNSSPHDTVWSEVKIIKSKSRREIEAIESPNEEIKEGNVHFQQESNSTWKMDIQALGVSYKVKRLKQQLLMLDKFTGKKESDENGKQKNGAKGLYSITSLLNKQIDRYQSLEGKIDHLCIRMHEKKLDWKSNIARAEDETKRMENFLEETFQIQRYMVATGQKLIDVQKKIASGFVGGGDEEDHIEMNESFDFQRFADSMKTLLQEVQRGLEVRISRIIGDLEGTLACDGFHVSKR